MAHFELKVHEKIGKEEFDDLKVSLNDLGYDVEISEHSNSGPYASLDWLIPTGIGLFIAKPYFETILKKAAEDHYVLLKEAFKRYLYPKGINPEKNEFKLVTNDGVEKETFFTLHFSIYTKITGSNGDLTLKLMFPKECSAEYFDQSIEKYSNFVSAFISSGSEAELADKLVEFDSGRRWTKILWLNDSSQEIELVDVVLSSKNKTIISRKVT
ncbi:hypothetical protein HHSLTHF2_25920 [Vreelandella venusta]|uniref:Uncharacterized protein n=1 Tax=Halomonas hydrothermalis TaxID=115561 RepID=A0A6F8U5E8_9GAMM|nr:hypothetical protein [Halomonas hydrothermalis]BCB08702.1 hypothetical protein HHSLTHF2_25920 [Halomonas hydrothermalis]